MEQCKHFKCCGIEGAENLSDGLCILHSRDADKDKESFDEALKAHRQGETCDNFRHIFFPGDVDFSGHEFGESAIFSSARFSGDANFDEATFSGEARFDYARISGNASFLRATFSGDTSFFETRISGNASFYEARISGNASFYEARISGDASFALATFSGDAIFEKARIRGDASFFEARISGKAIFSGASISGNASFGSVRFSGDAIFYFIRISGDASFALARISGDASFALARFSGDANFALATFNGEAKFSGAKFNDEASFFSATFKGGASFQLLVIDKEGSFDFQSCTFQEQAVFAGKSSADKLFSGRNVVFTNVQIAQEGAVAFRNANLSLCSLTDTDVRKIEFTGVTWAKVSKGSRRKRLYEELELHQERKKLKGNKTKSNLKALKWHRIEKVYRNLKQNYEENRDYATAGDFHIGEKEMRRRNPETSWPQKFMLTMYKWLSLYGERPLMPLIWFLAIFVGSTAIHHFFGGLSDPNALDAPCLSTTAKYSFETMLFLKPSNLVTVTTLSWLIKMVQSVISPILLGLTAFAVRQQMKR